MGIILGALGVASGIASAIQANQTRQRNKGIISKAYTLGQQRLNLSQGDTRESVAGGLGRRGLDQAGDVTIGGRAAPDGSVDVTGAHTLGAQEGLDLSREQNLEQTSMRDQRDAQLSGVNAEADQGIIGGVASAIRGGFEGAEAGKELNSLKGAGGSGVSKIGDIYGSPTDNKYPGSFGNVDPVNPLGRGAWAPAAGSTGSAAGASTTADFNVMG